MVFFIMALYCKNICMLLIMESTVVLTFHTTTCMTCKLALKCDIRFVYLFVGAAFKLKVDSLSVLKMIMHNVFVQLL